MLDWTNAQVGVSQRTGIVTVRVPVEGGYQDHFVPPDPANTDYQQFLAWKAEGHVPKILLADGGPDGTV